MSQISPEEAAGEPEEAVGGSEWEDDVTVARAEGGDQIVGRLELRPSRLADGGNGGESLAPAGLGTEVRGRPLRRFRSISNPGLLFRLRSSSHSCPVPLPPLWAAPGEHDTGEPAEVCTTCVQCTYMLAEHCWGMLRNWHPRWCSG